MCVLYGMGRGDGELEKCCVCRKMGMGKETSVDKRELDGTWGGDHFVSERVGPTCKTLQALALLRPSNLLFLFSVSGCVLCVALRSVLFSGKTGAHD